MRLHQVGGVHHQQRPRPFERGEVCRDALEDPLARAVDQRFLERLVGGAADLRVANPWGASIAFSGTVRPPTPNAFRSAGLRATFPSLPSTRCLLCPRAQHPSVTPPSSASRVGRGTGHPGSPKTGSCRGKVTTLRYDSVSIVCDHTDCLHRLDVLSLGQQLGATSWPRSPSAKFPMRFTGH